MAGTRQSTTSGSNAPKRARYQTRRANTRKRAHEDVDSPERSPPVNGQEKTQTTTSSNSGEPMSSILARYKAWRKAGSPHDLLCFECYQPDSLIPCDTCRRVYHDACKPNDSAQRERNSTSLWYCPVCVQRGWHDTPPMITPPASPVLTPASNVESTLDYVRSSASAPVQATAGSHPQLSYAANQDPTRTAKQPDRIQQKCATKLSTADLAPRKSRFNTLPQEVDSALWVVYRELESVPLLRQRITDLESGMSSLRQELNISRNEVALSRKIVERARSSEMELEKLKKGAANQLTAANEVETLKTRNQELETEVARMHAELGASTKTLEEWKQKLSSLIGA
ncbi:hypothetical protein BDV25DRAFT_147546 [Aspergillus avenaceus]|uniref:PHD-type domain-containing protein n=1 Tax=Aspergillus avenaceus TaxID=36643 RepID=A0A5N6U7I4_ASPAV|nr:hypothetical protein BDV25DRAFT_147546 [Aspergillus avenaceus]